MSKNNNDPAQQITTKIAKGIIIRAAFTIVAFITLYFVASVVMIVNGITIPGWFKPLYIIVSTVITIVILVRYLKKVYFTLKQGYQNLEANIRQGMMQNPPVDYTVYPQNGQQYNNNSNNSNNQFYN